MQEKLTKQTSLSSVTGETVTDEITFKNSKWFI